jgi:hypothetical protein
MAGRQRSTPDLPPPFMKSTIVVTATKIASPQMVTIASRPRPR